MLKEILIEREVSLPVEHDPLGDCDDAVLRLVQRAQLGHDGVGGVGHLVAVAVRGTCQSFEAQVESENALRIL